MVEKEELSLSVFETLTLMLGSASLVATIILVVVGIVALIKK